MRPVPNHSMPLRLGLTGAIGISERLNLVTGLEYSIYSSRFTYSLSGERIQKAQYVGIPVMLDYTLFDGKMVDVYFGAGAIGDICINATLSGRGIKRDGLTFSLLGAGGIQINILKHAGLYVEPQCSWMIPAGSDRLETWRTQHPLTFSISAGIRIY